MTAREIFHGPNLGYVLELYERFLRDASSVDDATRAFFRDALRLPGSDIGEGWWIFDFAEGDLGVHPVHDPGDAELHAIAFVYDDIRATVAEEPGCPASTRGP